MSYWGSGAADNDYAFDAVGAYLFLIKERMFLDADNVIQKSYPEQGIIASLECVRMIARQFRKCVKVHFGKKELAKAKEAFERWYDSVHEKLPSKYRDEIRSYAEAEFSLFEAEVIAPK